MSINVSSVTNPSPFWGIVDRDGSVEVVHGRPLIFATRKEARRYNKRRQLGIVRKVQLSFVKRSDGGA